MDLIELDSRTVTRMLLLVQNLGSVFRTFAGNVHAFQWQLVLVAGPDQEVLRQRLSRVRSVTTDCGVEFQLGDARDCLETFRAHRCEGPSWSSAGAVASPAQQFSHQLWFITWFSQHITALEKFVGPRACPEHEGLKGVTGDRMERVLHTALPHATDVLRKMLVAKRVIEQLDETVEPDHHSLRMCVGCMQRQRRLGL